MVNSRESLRRAAERLRSAVDRHITPERIRRYLKALTAVNAPSTASARLRGPVVESLLREDGLLESDRLHYVENYNYTGNTLLLCGDESPAKSIWYFAHLDTISYLVHPGNGSGYPLVPFCVHLMEEVECRAKVYRYGFESGRYETAVTGRVATRKGHPYFIPDEDLPLLPGDRVVLDVPYEEENETGEVRAHLDNAGAVAAALCAAPVLAEAGIDALIALTDEEEGPKGGENQVIGRGAARLAGILPQPKLSVVGDMQQAGGAPDADRRGEVENSTRIGAGAVLGEFSSLARGAVTPPDLYVLAREYARVLGGVGVKIQESNNAYTSRSDDVSVMLRNPNILLLGFPGINRHCDKGQPRASLKDLVDLAKGFAYFGLMKELYFGVGGGADG